MSEEVREFYAATVEEAVQKAMSEFGVSPEELSYEVVDPGSSGFMGIGARDARISARVSAPADLSTDKLAGEHETEAPAEELRDEEPEGLLLDAREYMEQLLEKMGLDARVDVYDAGEFIAVDVSTEQTGLFIGQKGETIDAIQYLLSLAVYKNRKFRKRLVIDSEGYRQRRVEAIQGIAHRMARRAIREQRPVELPPMNASERRVVHLYLQENENVFTRSEGSDESRRVKVFPS